MHLVSAAANAYWTALNHHGMTEQLPGNFWHRIKFDNGISVS